MARAFGDDAQIERRNGMFTIGQFSRLSGLTLKTIRLYHEKGLLPPSWVDGSSGYRYFDERDVERARLIAALRGLELSLSEIKELLGEYQEGGGVLAFLEAQRERIAARRSQLRRAARQLERMIRDEREALALVAAAPTDVVLKTLAPVPVAGLRWSGSYADTGRALGQVCRRFGRHAVDAPLNLYYDEEYKEDDADIESCIPVREATPRAGFTLHTLPGGPCASLMHRGPYSEIGRSYARLMRYLEQHGCASQLPYREIYRRGPGLLFKGNPRNYLTELQILVAAEASRA